MDHGHHALVRGGLGQQGQLLPGLLANPDAGLAAGSHNALDSRIVALAGHQHVVEAASAGLERLLHRMHAVENFHDG